MELQYKYRLEEFIQALPREMTMTRLYDLLYSDHKISRATFWRDRKIRIDDSQSIPGDRLEIYAALFGVSIEQLKQPGAERIKSIREQLPALSPSQNMKQLFGNKLRIGKK